MGITKFVFYFITFIFIAFPIGIGVTDITETTKEEEDLEIKYLSDEQVNLLDSLLNKRLKANGFRGSVLVAYKDQILMKYAHGKADYRSRAQIQTNSCFQLASVSKSFTATAIMMLKEDEKLEFDDLITKYIPEFPYEEITIKQLLQHTGGLQNYMYLVDNYWDNDSLITNEDVLDLLIKHDLPLNNLPGKRFLYSNTGYAMLALLVERVSEQSFASYLRENIFLPAQMDHSFTYNHQVMDTLSNRVIGYNRKGRRLYRYGFEPNDMVLGDKSVYSNLDDLFLYQKALNSYQLVSKPTLDEAYSKGRTNSRYARDFNYGYGWRLKQDKGLNLIYHNGLWHGFSSSLTREINNDVTVILLNNTTASISSIKLDLLNITIRELKKMDLKQAPKNEMASTKKELLPLGG